MSCFIGMECGWVFRLQTVKSEGKHQFERQRWQRVQFQWKSLGFFWVSKTVAHFKIQGPKNKPIKHCYSAMLPREREMALRNFRVRGI